MSLPNPENRLNDAMRLLQQGNAAEASALLEAETQSNPQNGVAFQYLGVARSQKGDIAGGIVALHEASRLMPQNAGVLYNLGVALAQARQTDEARMMLERSVALDPTNAKTRAALEKLGFPIPVAPTPTPAPAPLSGGYDLDLGVTVPMPTYQPSVPPAPAPAPVSQPTAMLGTIGGPPALGTIGGGPAMLGTIGGGPAPQPQSAPHPMPPPAYAPPSSGMGSYTPQNNAYTGTLPTASSSNLGGDAIGGGMYVPPAAISHQMMGREPNTGERISRGVGWGALFGQWWTLWIIVFDILIYGFKDSSAHPLGAVLLSLFFAVFFAAIGAIAGLIIGAINGDEGSGAIVGIVAALILFGIEAYMTHSFFNIIFWFFTGRFVGANIGKRVQERIGV